MKEIVWVFGTSAAGKETFINNVTANENLAAQFGWASEKIAACSESIEHIGQSDGDSVTNLREGILSHAPGLLESADVVLIKWQIVDSEATRPQRLKQQIPEARHSIVLLQAPENELTQRLPAKSWWERDMQVEKFVDTEIGLVRESLAKLEDFPITTVDSSQEGKYTVLAHPTT